MPHHDDFKQRLITGVSEDLRRILRGHLTWQSDTGTLEWEDGVDPFAEIPAELKDEYTQVWDMVEEATHLGYDRIAVFDSSEDEYAY